MDNGGYIKADSVTATKIEIGDGDLDFSGVSPEEKQKEAEFVRDEFLRQLAIDNNMSYQEVKTIFDMYQKQQKMKKKDKAKAKAKKKIAKKSRKRNR